MNQFQVALSVHIVAVAVWVGGMIVLAAILPAIRGAIDDEAFRSDVIVAVANRFQVVAWTGFAAAVVTGVWLLLTIGPIGGVFARRLGEKLVMVAISAIAAGVHAFWLSPHIRKLTDSDPHRAQSLRKWTGALGVIALVAAIAAVFAAVRMATS